LRFNNHLTGLIDTAPPVVSVQELKKQVAALTAGLEKVSAQLELSKSAPQVVNNP